MTRTGQPTVLLVEDEPLLRTLTSEHLQDAGFGVVEAAIAAEAIALLEHHPEIDILFTDVHLPGAESGLELAAKVRDSRPRLHVIITSGRWQRSDAEVPEGALFVQKPYALDAVTRLIGALVKAA